MDINVSYSTFTNVFFYFVTFLRFLFYIERFFYIYDPNRTQTLPLTLPFPNPSPNTNP